MTTKTRREQELEREVETLRALLADIGRPGQGESQELLRLAYDAADLGIWENDLRTGGVFFDERARVHYGFDTNEVTLADVIARVHPDDAERLRREIAAATGPASDGRYLTEYRILHPDGTVHWLRVQVRVHFEGQGAARRSIKGIGTSQDITGRKQAEEVRARFETQLRQAQKLESIGRLAGGVAHDFNNLLTVIQGHASLLLAGRPARDPLFDDLEQIRLAAERAAALTRQLLTFSRRQVLAPAIIDLNSLVVDLDKLLRRLIGEDISLATVLQPDLGQSWPTRARSSRSL